MRRALLPLLLVLLVPAAGHARTNKRKPDDMQLAPSVPVVIPMSQTRKGLLQSPATAPLQAWTFDDPITGAANAQGWTTADITAQPPQFHVDDFNGLSGTFLRPITATKSLWLGRRACQGNACSLLTDGYGNNWEQYFFSAPLTVGGNVNITFKLRFDCEPSYDELSLSYAGADQVLHPLRTWNGAGTETVVQTIPGTNLGGKISFLFKFTSDGFGSNEDGQYNSQGGAVIDDIHVFTATQPNVNTETFESEPVAQTYTNDFLWLGAGSGFAGDFAGLNAGNTVLQQDPLHTNTTHFWGFFTGSPDNYACGGHPEQLSVPLSQPTGANNELVGVDDELESPQFPVPSIAAGHALVLTFDVYADMPYVNNMAYGWRVRSKVGGFWKPWKAASPNWYDPAKEWKTRAFNVNSLILPGATDMQLGIYASDFCPAVCAPGSPVTCHSNGPLIDNVQLRDGNTPAGVSTISPVDATTGTTPVSIHFLFGATAGETSLVTSSAGPTPSGFTLGNGIYYNLSTTSTIGGNFDLCITYDPASLTVPENSLRLMHWDTQLNPAQWVDITLTQDLVTHTICGRTDHFSPFAIGTPNASGVGDMPRAFALHQNVPNPFNPVTTITYDVPNGGAKVSIRVYDAAGHLLRTLVDDNRPAGTQTVTWDGHDQFGGALASGVYFYKMTAGSFVESKRMVLLK